MDWITFETGYANDVLGGNPWKVRIEKMAAMLGKGIESVADMGAGESYLKECIDTGIAYYPVDYCRRDDNTIVCDFNKGEFPDIHVQAYFISGCLEYIEDWRWFISRLCSGDPEEIIISYAVVEEQNRNKQRGWEYNSIKCGFANALTEEDIVREFQKNGYSISNRDYDAVTKQPLFKFMRSEKDEV